METMRAQAHEARLLARCWWCCVTAVVVFGSSILFSSHHQPCRSKPTRSLRLILFYVLLILHHWESIALVRHRGHCQCCVVTNDCRERTNRIRYNCYKFSITERNELTFVFVFDFCSFEIKSIYSRPLHCISARVMEFYSGVCVGVGRWRSIARTYER